MRAARGFSLPKGGRANFAESPKSGAPLPAKRRFWICHNGAHEAPRRTFFNPNWSVWEATHTLDQIRENL
jgi:hypothetical protein